MKVKEIEETFKPIKLKIIIETKGELIYFKDMLQKSKGEALMELFDVLLDVCERIGINEDE